MLNKSIEISKSILIIGIVGGLGIILLVGLLCGLVARPNNCIQLDSVKQTTAYTTKPAVVTTATNQQTTGITNQGSTSKNIKLK
jgi:hypothetical protein